MKKVSDKLFDALNDITISSLIAQKESCNSNNTFYIYLPDIYDMQKKGIILKKECLKITTKANLSLFHFSFLLIKIKKYNFQFLNFI